MLDSIATIELSEQTWHSLPSRSALPCDQAEYFAAKGIAGATAESRRQFVRIHMREIAVLVRGDECHAIYTKDASPKGVCLITPVQFFPQDRFRVLIDEQGVLELELRRCHRLGPHCYECGTTFADGVIPPGVYKRLIMSGRGRH